MQRVVELRVTCFRASLIVHVTRFAKGPTTGYYYFHFYYLFYFTIAVALSTYSPFFDKLQK